jgi:hypothetical protein
MERFLHTKNSRFQPSHCVPTDGKEEQAFNLNWNPFSRRKHGCRAPNLWLLDAPGISHVQANLDEEEWCPNLQSGSSTPNWDASDTEDDIDSEDFLENNDPE